MKCKIASLLMLFVAVCLFSACQKQTNVTPETKFVKQQKLSYAYGEPPPGGGTQGAGVPIYYDANGYFFTNYGGVGAIGFGTNFPYPNSVPSGYDGSTYPIGSLTGFPYAGSNLLSFTQIGSNFTATFGTYVGGLPLPEPVGYAAAYADYITALTAFATTPQAPGTLQPVLTYYLVQHSVNYVGGSSNGIITITGQFVYDSTSPTNISIVPASFTPAAAVE